MTGSFVIGVDVGTGSARAGVFDKAGTLIAHASSEIRLWKEANDQFEQSSENIWDAVCKSVRAAVSKSRVNIEEVVGIGFDATCSLVLIGENGQPVSASSSDDAQRNIIVWMDQRARAEAASINAMGHPVLAFVGNKISPEMQIPKLLWLKKNRRIAFEAAHHFFDLTDFLTWKATGSTARSSCTLTCKWTYLAHEKKFDESFFRNVGLEELVRDGFSRIGKSVLEPGESILPGLSNRAAEELALPAGIAVAAGLIDAHAGGLGSLGKQRYALAYVFGTSACLMASSETAVHVDGVWGPYYNAMLPGQWLLEGGQSTAGAAIDQILRCHPAYPAMLELGKANDLSVIELIEADIKARKLSSMALATEVADLHIVPDFLGNRSPQADPNAAAIMCGLGMEDDRQSLVRLYVAAVLGVAYGAKQTIDALSIKAVDIQSIVISGGAAKSSIVCQLLADATGLIVNVSSCDEPVLLGSAILAATASKLHSTLHDASEAMTATGQTFFPAANDVLSVHRHKYSAYRTLQSADRTIGKYENYKLMWAQQIDPHQKR